MTHATASQTPSIPEVVRLSGAAGMVAAIPSCIGFEPHDSLVVVCLTGPRHRLGPVARVDLFPPGTHEPAAQLMAFARRYADEAAVICYHDGGRPGCMDDVLDALRRENIPVFGALSVREGRIRAASTDEEFAHDTGVRHMPESDPQAQTLAAATAMAGRRTLTSREQLVDSIAAPTGTAATKMRRAIEQICEAIPRQRDRTELPGQELVDLVDEALADSGKQHATRGSVTRGTAATIIALSTHIGCRDRMLYYAVGHESPDVVAALISIARQCPDDYAAEICSVLGMAAYRFGDGALAQCALDRTFAHDPRHRLGQLLATAMAGAMPPSELANISAARSELEPGDPTLSSPCDASDDR